MDIPSFLHFDKFMNDLKNRDSFLCAKGTFLESVYV